jgi:DNA-binding GntR family transcriptional regulator
MTAPLRIVKRGELPVSVDRQKASESNLTQLAFDKISSAIVYGRLDLGEPLSEAELAKALGISKSPVRNAVAELKTRGLVEIIPQSGTYVFSPSREQIIQLSELRFILEENAIRLSMERDPQPFLAELQLIVAHMREAWAAGSALEIKKCDTEFHWCFIRYAGNEYLTSAYSDISLMVEALRYRFMDTVTYRNKAFEEHQRMIDLLAAGRVAKVIDLLRDHVQRTKEFQSNVDWSNGRSQRKLYRERDYANILLPERVELA